MALAMVLLLSGIGLLRQDLAYTRAETELSFWGRGDYQPREHTIERTGLDLAALLAAQPAHPDYLSLDAYYQSWRGHWSTGVTERLDFNQQAVDSQYAALQARPAHRQGWTKMLEYAARTTGGEAVIDTARARLQLLQSVQQAGAGDT